MTRLPSRFRRLDDALADLPGEEEPLYLTELDGLLTGVLASPAPIAPAVWLPLVWGGGPAPFEEADDSRWFVDMVLARHGEIARDLARGKPQPIFDVDERNGETLWEAWIEGFAMAMPLWPEDAPLAEGALAGLAEIELLIAVARDETELTSDEINRMCDEAPARIGGALVALSTTTAGRVAGSAPAAAAAKPGRNDPCPCGSGKKHKRCCG